MDNVDISQIYWSLPGITMTISLSIRMGNEVQNNTLDNEDTFTRIAHEWEDNLNVKDEDGMSLLARMGFTALKACLDPINKEIGHIIDLEQANGTERDREV